MTWSIASFPAQRVFEYPGFRMDERLRPIQRLQCPFEFKTVFEKGSSFRSPCLRVHYLRSDREVSRMGLVVTRRIGGAVARNRVKRLLRDVFRRNQRLLLESFDIVLVPQGGVRSHAEYLEAFLKFTVRVGQGASCAR